MRVAWNLKSAQKKSTSYTIRSTSMKRKSLIEAVSPEARDFIEAGTPKPQFVQTQPEKAEGKNVTCTGSRTPKKQHDPAEKKEISHCGLSILNGVGEPTMPSEHPPLCSVRCCGRNIMNRIYLFSLLSFSRSFQHSTPRKSIIAISQSTLVIQPRMKLRLPRREQADSGRNIRHALEQNPGFWPWRLRRFSQARFKTFGQN